MANSFKKTEVKLKLLTDIDKLLIVEKMNCMNMSCNLKTSI